MTDRTWIVKEKTVRTSNVNGHAIDVKFVESWGWWEWTEYDSTGTSVCRSGPQNLHTLEEAETHYRRIRPGSV